MGGRRIKSLKARVGRECCISRGGQMGKKHSGVMEAGGLHGGSHSVGRCGISKRSRDAVGSAAPGVRAI